MISPADCLAVGAGQAIGGGTQDGEQIRADIAVVGDVLVAVAGVTHSGGNQIRAGGPATIDGCFAGAGSRGDAFDRQTRVAGFGQLGQRRGVDGLDEHVAASARQPAMVGASLGRPDVCWRRGPVITTISQR